MSSILKALKKLEEEKTLHEESAGINLSREILKQNRGNRKIIRWLWLLGSSAAIVIIILTAALLRKPSPNAAANSGELPTTARQPTLPPLRVEKLLIAPEATGSTAGIKPPGSMSANEPDLIPARQRLDQSAETQSQNRAALPPKATPLLAAPPKTDPVVRTVPVRPTAGSEQTLILSGIAWNKDSADRLAIINGQPIATGSNFNGIVVEEILQDRVKLSHNGKIFELLIGRDAKLD